MTASRLLIPALLSGLACLLVAPLALRDAPRSLPPVADRTTGVAVLHDWDRARAAAWREGDPAALSALYTDESEAGRADRELLAAYAGRGLRVTGMRMQVAEVGAVSVGSQQVDLVVTDRLVGAVAVGRHTRVELPRDRWSRRRVLLVRVGEDWRVAEIAEVPGGTAPYAP